MSAGARLAGGVSPRLGAGFEWRLIRRELSARLVDALVRPEDTVLDLGAHHGVYTHRLARLVGPRGRVHAFEPDPESVAVLRRVCRRASNVEVHPVAASDRRGRAELHVPLLARERMGALASLDVPEARAGIEHEVVRVRAARVDDELPDDRPLAFVKCDVEGHEGAVLAGARRTLAASRPILLVEIEQRHQRGDVRELLAWIAALGYDGWCLTPAGLRPLEAFDLERDQLRFLRNGFEAGRMAPGYVNEFLFAPPGTELPPAFVDASVSR